MYVILWGRGWTRTCIAIYPICFVADWTTGVCGYIRKFIFALYVFIVTYTRNKYVSARYKLIVVIKQCHNKTILAYHPIIFSPSKNHLLTHFVTNYILHVHNL